MSQLRAARVFRVCSRWALIYGTVPANSGIQRKRMVRRGAGSVSDSTRALRARAISSMPPLPLALSLALGWGWHQVAENEDFPGRRVRPGKGGAQGFDGCLEKFRTDVSPQDDRFPSARSRWSMAPWFLLTLKPTGILSRSSQRPESRVADHVRISGPDVGRIIGDDPQGAPLPAGLAHDLGTPAVRQNELAPHILPLERGRFRPRSDVDQLGFEMPGTGMGDQRQRTSS